MSQENIELACIQAKKQVRNYKSALKNILHETYQDFNTIIDINTLEVNHYGNLQEVARKYYKAIENIKVLCDKALNN